MPSLKSRFTGCLLGLAPGDALGAPFEGPSRANPDLGLILQNHASEDAYSQKLAKIKELLDTNLNDSYRMVAELGSGIEVLHSVPTAICCALRHPQSFETAVLEAVNLGGDTDTIASMNGAIS